MKTLLVLLHLFLLLVNISECKWPPDCSWPIIGDKCYIISTVASTFAVALSACQTKGGQLAMITDFETSLELAKAYRNDTCLRGESASYRFWIGIYDQTVEGTFRYTNGTNVQFDMLGANPWATDRFGYKNPDNRDISDTGGVNSNDADCVSVNQVTGLWYDDYCPYSKRYICEFSNDAKCNVKDLSIPNSEYEMCFVDHEVSFGFTIGVECNEGFVLVGSSNVTCFNDGNWSQIPECVQGCDAPETLPHATFLSLKPQYVLGDKVTYLCDEGFVANVNLRRSHFDMVCSKDGHWLPQYSGCTREKQYTAEDVYVKKGESVELACEMDEVKPKKRKIADLDDEDEFTQVHLWLKDSQEDYPCADCQTDADGTFVVGNVTEAKTGIYSCFLTGNTAAAATKIYNLKLKEDPCEPSSKVPQTLTVREDKSLLLPCPHGPEYTDFTWFKDGQRYDVNSRRILYKDGSLFLKNIHFSQQGLYICQMTKKNTACAKNHTIDVTVLASATSICGQSKDKDDHPWTVSLWQKDEMAPFCYGSLIHEDWVVTSGQCLRGFYRKRKLDIFVRFGKSYAEDDLHVDIPISTVKIHPMFSPKLYVNDIGLVKLKKSVRFSSTIKPICLSKVDLTVKSPCDKSPPLKGIVSGWGPLDMESLENTELFTETMILGDPESCFDSGSSYHENSLCFYKSDDSRPTFAGEAGSPFEVEWKGKVHLLGVFSWGQRGVRIGDYDFFTKISYYVDWIYSTID